MAFGNKIKGVSEHQIQQIESKGNNPQDQDPLSLLSGGETLKSSKKKDSHVESPLTLNSLLPQTAQ